ncbi:MAG: OmpA family protein [Chlorobi bacterium]|nr:OmpA family protein [Chlorobiota bacterium]
MKIYTRLIVALLFVLVPIGSLWSEDKKDEDTFFTRVQYGLFAHYMMTGHYSDFTGFKDWETCCPKFESGSGSGFALGALIEYPLSQTWFLSGRFGYENSTAELIDWDEQTVALDGEPVEGKFEYMIRADLSNVFTDLLLGYKPVNRLSLYLGSHITIASSYLFDMRETMLQPSDRGTFENGSRVRNDATGEEIPGAASFGFAVMGGLSYEFPLNRRQTLRLVPEMFFTIGLTDYVENIDWSGNSIRAGLALKFSDAGEYPLHSAVSSSEDLKIIKYKSCEEEFARFFPEIIIIKPFAEAAAAIRSWNLDLFFNNKLLKNFKGSGDVPKELIYNVMTDSVQFVVSEGLCSYNLLVEDIHGVDTEARGTFNVRHEITELAAESMFAGISSDGSAATASVKSPLKIKRNITSEITPLLNYVFFDKMSTKFPGRYKILNKSDAEKFAVSKLHKAGTMGTYYNVLNVIGKRLKDNPQATVTLNGCNDGTGSEKDNIGISVARAQKVKRYFRDVWQINENQMKIFVSKSRGGTPKKMSASSQKSNRKNVNAENRRVEIIPDENFAYIVEPLLTRDTVIESSLDVVTIEHGIRSDAGIKSWSAKLIADGELLNEFSGTDNLPNKIVFEIDGIKERINQLKSDLRCEFSVNDKNDLHCGSKWDVSVDLNVIDSSRYKYSLILFDFKSSQLKEKNRKIIDMMRNSVRADADVSITGFTDIIGKSAFNLNFSKRRALATAKNLFGIKFEDIADSSFKDSSTETLVSDYKLKFVDANIDKKVNLKISGKGETLPLLHDNTFPEGRFYSRTVTVDIVNKEE